MWFQVNDTSQKLETTVQRPEDEAGKSCHPPYIYGVLLKLACFNKYIWYECICEFSNRWVLFACILTLMICLYILLILWAQLEYVNTIFQKNK